MFGANVLVHDLIVVKLQLGSRILKHTEEFMFNSMTARNPGSVAAQ